MGRFTLTPREMRDQSDPHYLSNVVEDAEDRMVSEYRARVEAGEITALDRANAAVRRADQARSVLSEGDHAEAGEAAFKRALMLARLVARMEAADAPEAADSFAVECEAAVAKVQAFDVARFDGLASDQPHPKLSGRRAAQTSG